jgi:hypothetical protein
MTTEQTQEAVWIAAQVAAMPVPDRGAIESWAALLDIRGLLATERLASAS